MNVLFQKHTFTSINKIYFIDILKPEEYKIIDHLFK